jgi:hypothetical protein
MYETCTDKVQYLLEERVRDLYSGDYADNGDIPWKVGQKPETYRDLLNLTRPHKAVHNKLGWGWMHEIKESGTIHLLDSDFVDCDTLREFAETFYRCSGFTIDWDAFDALEKPDYWSLGLNVDRLVHNMWIKVYGGHTRQGHVNWVKHMA